MSLSTSSPDPDTRIMDLDNIEECCVQTESACILCAILIVLNSFFFEEFILAKMDYD